MRMLTLAAAAATLLGGSAALAEEACNVADAARQPMAALLAKLEGEGLVVRAIELDDGCYEVEVTGADGRRMEQAYHPESFAMLSVEYEDGGDDEEEGEDD